MPDARLPSPETHDHIESLSRDECARRLAAQGVGRIGVSSHGKVAVFPVNYVVHGDDVVVRVRGEGELGEATHGTYVAIEIDHADSMYHEGWSVLVQGRCTHVTDPDALERALPPAPPPLGWPRSRHLSSGGHGVNQRAPHPPPRELTRHTQRAAAHAAQPASPVSTTAVTIRTVAMLTTRSRLCPLTTARAATAQRASSAPTPTDRASW